MVASYWYRPLIEAGGVISLEHIVNQELLFMLESAVINAAFISYKFIWLFQRLFTAKQIELTRLLLCLLLLL